MVAGPSSCRCSKCGEVCPGKFAGCSTVWERGPNQVFFRQPPAAVMIDIAEVPATPPPNGAKPQSPGPLIVLPGTKAATPPESPSELRLLLQALRAELQHLTRKIDETWADRADSVDLERAAVRLTEVAETLPNRIVRSIAEVFETQHQIIMADIDRAISERVPQAAVAEALVQLPARMAIQLAEVSNRFGERLSEVSDRIEQLMATNTGVHDRSTAERNDAVLAEIDRLTRVVAGTVELLSESGQAV